MYVITYPGQLNDGLCRELSDPCHRESTKKYHPKYNFHCNGKIYNLVKDLIIIRKSTNMYL